MTVAEVRGPRERQYVSSLIDRQGVPPFDDALAWVQPEVAFAFVDDGADRIKDP